MSDWVARRGVVVVVVRDWVGWVWIWHLWTDDVGTSKQICESPRPSS